MPPTRPNRRGTSSDAEGSARRALQALAADEKRFRVLLDALPEPILLASVDRRVSGFNQAAVAMFGAPRDLYSRPLSDVLPFVSAEPNGHPVSLRWQGRVVTNHGLERDLEVRLTQVFLSRGHALEYIVHDVSHLVDVSRQREQLLYSAAHELRGSVTVVDNTLEILIADAATMDPADAATLLERAHRAARRLTLLIGQVLNTASIRAGRFVVHPESVSLLALIEEALDAVGPILTGRGQHAALDPASADPAVNADRGSAPRILINLLANASKYSPAGSTIRVRVTPEIGLVRVDVEDERPGISPEQQIGLFDRYVRTRTTDQPTGFGLGLAIAREMVEAHGGRMGLASRVGVGTGVWFTLPLA